MLTFAKGVTSGYAPLGGVLVSRPHRRAVPRADVVVPPRHHLRRPPGELRRGPGQPRRHGARGPARPGARASRASSAARLDTLLDLPIVARGARHGLLLRHRDDQGRRAVQRRRVRVADPRVPVRAACWSSASICRADDRGDPVIQLSPPLVSGPEEFESIAGDHPPDPARGVEGAGRPREPTGVHGERSELDEVDKAIIRPLQADGRTPYSKLGPDGRAVAGGGAPAGAAADRPGRDADRRRHRPGHPRPRPPGDDRRRASRATCGPWPTPWPRSTTWSTWSSPPVATTCWSRWSRPTPPSLLDLVDRRHPQGARRRRHRDPHLPQAGEADLHLGCALMLRPGGGGLSGGGRSPPAR